MYWLNFVVALMGTIGAGWIIFNRESLTLEYMFGSAARREMYLLAVCLVAAVINWFFFIAGLAGDWGK
jgi:hypothetical protein